MTRSCVPLACSLLTVALVLSGCGGGRGFVPFPPHPDTPGTPNTTVTVGEAKGFYSGNFSPEFANGASFYAIVLPDDRFYAFWDSSSGFRTGFMVGQGKSASGTYVADLINYFWDSGVPSPLTAKYVPGVSLKGSITLGNGFRYELNATAVTGSSFNYDVPADLARVVGEWPNITITADGTLTVSRGACSYSGTIAPDPKKNFFNVTLTSGSACLYPNSTGSGVAVESLLSDGTTRQLLLGAPVGGWYLMIWVQR